MHDVAIIGSGLGGLMCGAMLSREGLNVCVLEKNSTIGGSLQSFRRGGRSFDTGIHYVGGLDNGQVLNQYLRYLGVRDTLNVVRMDDEGFDTVVIGGREYPWNMGYGNFAAGLGSQFPSQRANIEQFCKMLRGIGGTMSIEKLRRGSLSEGAMAYLERPAFDTIDQMIADPALRSVLRGTSLLYDGIREKTTLYHYGMIVHSFIESSWRMAGGSQQLADALAAKIAAAGGTVRTNAQVTRIGVRGSKVSGVEIGGQEFVEARHVISDIHPAATLSLVEKTPQVKRIHISRLRGLANSVGVFTVYMAMRQGAAPYINRNYYIHEDDRTWNTEYDSVRDTPRAVLFNMQPGGQAASLLCPMTMTPFEPWAETTIEHRGDDYLALKNHLAERIMAAASRRFLWLDDAVERIYTSSPLTWRDYTGTPGGAAYGIVKSWQSPFTTLIPTNTRFDNLQLTGQNINVHGALGVSVTAAITCSRLLGTEYLAKKIGNA